MFHRRQQRLSCMGVAVRRGVDSRGGFVPTCSPPTLMAAIIQSDHRKGRTEFVSWLDVGTGKESSCITWMAGNRNHGRVEGFTHFPQDVLTCTLIALADTTITVRAFPLVRWLSSVLAVLTMTIFLGQPLKAPRQIIQCRWTPCTEYSCYGKKLMKLCKADHN